MAVRREVLLVGGFDPAFRYYLDDTDLRCVLRMRGTGPSGFPTRRCIMPSPQATGAAPIACR
jgi:GT2 family glycosyltransferase